MSVKIRNIFLSIFILILAATAFTFAFTSARYSEQVKSSGEEYADGIDYIVVNQVRVHTVDEFITAVSNGYSNIIIDESVQDPLIITSGIQDVNSDLIIDLNGHDIQRNNREPMLKVNAGVRLTVIDTKGGGSFYNPVGSVLEVDGGTLTVVSGTFESGVRAREYNTAADTDLTGPDHGTIEKSISTTLYVKGGDTYTAAGTGTLPVIVPQITQKGKSATVNGNIYCKDQVGNYGTFDGTGKLVVPVAEEDSYLYYVIEGVNDNSIMASTGSADYYYEYYVDPNGGNYNTGFTAGKSDGKVKVTVYGYNNVFAAAGNAGGGYTENNKSNFATIKMLSGTLNTRGGEYYSYFGTPESYCVYATGGLMTVESGTYEAKNNGVCVYCNYTAQSSGPAAKNTLTIENGNFKSYLGANIKVDNGEMLVKFGRFTKDASANSKDTTEELANGAAIEITKTTGQTGAATKLEVKGDSPYFNDDNVLSMFDLVGSGVCGIRCSGGASLDAYGAMFIFNRPKTETATSAYQNNIGIYNEGGVIAVSGCLFYMPDASSTGIVSTKEKDSAAQTPELTVESSIFSMTGEKATGVRATAGTVNLGSTENIGVPGQDHYVMFYIDHVLNCYGVHVKESTADSGTAGEKITVKIISAQFVMGQKYYANEYLVPKNYNNVAPTFNGAGIYMNASNGEINVNRMWLSSAGSFVAGIWLENGSLKQEQPVQQSEQSASTETNGVKMALFMGTHQFYYGQGGSYDNKTNEDTVHTNNKDNSSSPQPIQFHATEVNGHYRKLFGTEWFVAQYGTGYYGAGKVYNVAQANATAAYGVYASGGTIQLNNAYIAQYSTYSCGIKSIGNSTIEANNFECDVRINAGTLEYDANGNTNESFSGQITPIGNSELPANTRTGCPGKTGTDGFNAQITSTAIKTSGGQITIANSHVITDAYGYAVDAEDNSGSTTAPSLTFTGANGNNVLKASHATAITVDGGTLTVDNGLTINCTIQADASKNMTLKDGTVVGERGYNDYNNKMISPDAILVTGGSLQSTGILNISFTGLQNVDQLSYDSDKGAYEMEGDYYIRDTASYKPLENEANSYAVRVKGDTETKVVIRQGEVVNHCGGGVSVNGGNVFLGVDPATASGTSDHLSVTADCGADKATIGYAITTDDFYTALRGSNYTSGNWQYYVSKNGGNAVSVADGDLEIYSGSYVAALGNGIQITNGKVTVQNGTFEATQNISDLVAKKWVTDIISGVGSYYGLMLAENGTFISNSGTYTGHNGGAFVSGSYYKGKKATADIVKGVFSAYAGNSGFAVGGNVMVNFGQKSVTVEQDITVSGNTCAIAVEQQEKCFNGFGTVQINFYGGYYYSKRSDVIWKENSSATIQMGGGHFKVDNGSIANDYLAWSSLLMTGCHAYQDADKTQQISDSAYSYQYSEVYIG